MSPALGGAAQFTVNSALDAPDALPGDGLCITATGQCTLRAALTEADNLMGPDTVVLPAGTYAVGSTLPIASPLTLVGPSGARATTIAGNGTADTLSITSAVVTVRGVTISGGGRGVSVSAPDVVLDQVAVRGNGRSSAATLRGGGVRVLTGGNVLLTRGLVAANSITSTGGQAIGGGVVVENGGVFTALASTIAGNAANGSGSGGFGGGVAVASGGQATLRHVTLAGNSASSSGSAANYGGNVYVNGAAPAGQLLIADSVLAAGQAVSGANCFGSLTAQGRNIDSGTTCGLGGGHLSATDPQLLPLGDNGGPTDSRALATTSPARDAALSCPAGGLDQRGGAAPAGAACDIGAAELSADLRVTVQASQAAAGGGENVTYVVRVANSGMDAAPATVLEVSPLGATPTLASTSAGTCTLEVRCQLGTLARGQEAMVTVVVRAGEVPIAFIARASSALPDPAPGDDIATLTTPVAVVPPPAGPPAGPGTPTAPPAGDPQPVSPAPPTGTTPPALGRLLLVGQARTARPLRVSTRLSAVATVTVTIDRLVPGRRLRGACRATARTGVRCTVLRRIGTVRLRAGPGAATLRIPARVGGRALAPGRYRLGAVALDGAGRRSPVRLLTVRVVR